MKAPLGWKKIESFMLVRPAGGRVLVVHASRVYVTWDALAVESVDGRDAARPRTAQDVFDDHAHHAIGSFDTADEAFKAAMAYADAWRPHTAAACDCGEIKSSKRPTRRGPEERTGRGSLHSGSGAEPQHALSCARCGIVHLDRCAP